MPNSFEGQVALITGGSQGIGRAVAQALAAQGMNLVLAARTASKLESTAEELRKSGVRVVTVPTDVSKLADLERLVATCVSEFGGIDVLVNNAGIEAFQAFHNLSIEEIQATIATNTTGSLLLTRLVIPVMLKKGRGRIINMASTASLQAPPFGATYAATKASLYQFSMALRLEYKGTGISISAICPGFTDDGGIYEEIKEIMGRRMPFLMRGTTAEKVARKVVQALRTDPPVLVVDTLGVRLTTVLSFIFPRYGEWLTHKVAYRFFRRLANKRSEDEEAQPQ
jgi:short-subunit dehydrogenase